MTTTTISNDSAEAASTNGRAEAQPTRHRLPALLAPRISRDRIVVQEGFNPRLDFGGQADLVKSIRERGFDFALIVRPGEGDTLIVVDGERRLRAADELGLTELPAEVRDMSEIEALELALSSAHQRRPLNPLEEARGFANLMRLGKSKREIGAQYSESVAYVTKRVQILELPESVQQRIAKGKVALGDVPTLLKIAAISPKLAERTAALDRRVDAHAAEAAALAAPVKEGLWSTRTRDLSALKLNDEAKVKIADLSDRWSEWYPRFSGDDLDAARALGVLFAEEDPGWGYRAAVVCDTEVFKQMVLDCLARDHEKFMKQQAAKGKPAPGTPAAEGAKATRRAERQREVQIARQARGANLDLGVRTATKLQVDGNDKAFVELFAYLLFGDPETSTSGAYDPAQLAGAGLRLVLEEWQTEEQLKSGKTRIHYAGSSKSQYESDSELRTRFWEWFKQAKTAEEMRKRLVFVLSVAHEAVPEALPRTRRVSSPVRLREGGKAVKALKRLTRGSVPPTVKQVRHAIANPTDDQADAPGANTTVTRIAAKDAGGKQADPTSEPGSDLPDASAGQLEEVRAAA